MTESNNVLFGGSFTYFPLLRQNNNEEHCLPTEAQHFSLKAEHLMFSWLFWYDTQDICVWKHWMLICLCICLIKYKTILGNRGTGVCLHIISWHNLSCDNPLKRLLAAYHLSLSLFSTWQVDLLKPDLKTDLHSASDFTVLFVFILIREHLVSNSSSTQVALINWAPANISNVI